MIPLSNLSKLDQLIINAITTIRGNKQRPHENTIYDVISKDLKEIMINQDQFNARIVELLRNNTLENKPFKGQTSYYIKNPVLNNKTKNTNNETENINDTQFYG